MSHGKSLFKGAFILTAAGLIGKMMAALYRIPFTRVVGDEGAGLYALSYSLYNILFALSTAGIPLAVSKMVAVTEERQAYGESVRIFKVTLAMLSALGFLLAVFVFTKADWLAEVLFNEPRVALSLQALAPAMLFSCLMSAFRGFFQGKREMIPTALSQILEQFFRVATILISVMVLMGSPLPIVVATASFGSSIGQIVGFFFLLAVFLRFWSKHRPANQISETAPSSTGDIMKDLLYLAIPISIGALALPILGFIDSTLSLARLEGAGGFTHTEAIIQNGYLVNSSMPILNLLFIITTAVSASLIPAITEAHERGDHLQVLRDIRATLMLTVIIMLPAGAGLFMLGAPITQLLYDQPDAGSAMSSVAFTVLALGLYQVSAGALQGLGRVMIPMQSLLMAVILKCLIAWVLCGIPGFGIKGAGLATVGAFFAAAVHNMIRLSNLVGTGWFSFRMLIIKPGIAVLGMMLVVWLSNAAVVTLTGSDSLGALFAIGSGALSYFLILFVIGGFEAAVLSKIPRIGPKLANRFGNQK